ncbi:MAG: LUD domain-containing protein [Rhodospirillales bacterium]|nr:LUD domain-containing protein [Rhodospirillales bacterium]
MSSREIMLAKIRNSLGRGPLGGDAIQAIEKRLKNPTPNTIPARGQGGAKERAATFSKMASQCDCTVDLLNDVSEIPGALKTYLETNNQPMAIRVAPVADLQDIPWDEEPALVVNYGNAEETDHVGLISAWGGVAESGTIVALSGPQNPTALNFLPDTFVALLYSKKIASNYEEAWSRVRSESNQDNFMPRTVNWITGPSRTADIEQTLLLGVHGPRRVHILLLDNEKS